MSKAVPGLDEIRAYGRLKFGTMQHGKRVERITKDAGTFDMVDTFAGVRNLKPEYREMVDEALQRREVHRLPIASKDTLRVVRKCQRHARKSATARATVADADAAQTCDQ